MTASTYAQLAADAETTGRAIAFEQRCVTLLCIDRAGMAAWTAADRDSFMAEVEWLAMRHHGRVDRQRAGDTVLFFDDPGCALQMALNLQRCASELRLRIGLHTADAGIASFRAGGSTFWCVVGAGVAEAAQVASTACGGSIVISPQAYALVRSQVREARGCLLTEESDRDDATTASLTPAPGPGETQASTFAGLGMASAWAPAVR